MRRKKLSQNWCGNNLSQLSSGDASDSICPKGWGIARYSGDGSYEKLIRTTYGERKNSNYTQIYSEYDKIIRLDQTLIQLSFIRSGNFAKDYGTPNLRTDGGILWENRVANYLSNARTLNFYTGNIIYLQNSDTKTLGFSLRCVAK